MRRVWLFADVLVVTVVTVVAGFTAPVAAERLPAAASDEHLWFVQVTDAGADLMHHAIADDGPTARRLMALPQRPDRVAAWGSTVYLVFGGDDAREVFQLEAVRDPSSGVYFSRPPDRLEALPPLPASGALIDLTAGETGPIALVRHPDSTTASLYQLDAQGWSEEVLEGIAAPVAVTVMGPRTGPQVPAVATEREIIWLGDGDGPRRTQSHDLGGTLRRLVRIGPRTLAVAEVNEMVVLEYVRAGRALRLAEFKRPGGEWAVVGVGEGPRLIMLSPLSPHPMGSFITIDPVTGARGLETGFAPARLEAFNLLRMPALLAIGITVLLLIIVVRPATTALLPDDAGLLGLAPRGVALALDLAVGVLVALAVLRVSPATLLITPLGAPTLADAIPQLLALSVAFGHMTLSEVFGATTLGKRLVGARVVAVEGGRPPMGRLLIRNLVKVLVLLLPPLVVVVLTNPYRQGLHDLSARTVVVGRVDPAQKAHE